jgi:hypothetical protein
VGNLREYLFHIEDEVNPFIFGGRVLVFLLILGFGLFYLATPLETMWRTATFWHGIDLVIHEAGHIVFIPFGDFMRVLGGSLLQCLVPLLFAGEFLRRRNPFGAAFGLWWFAQNLLDVAVYVNDARAQVLPLLGGVTGRDVPGYHDWHNLLGRLGWLEADHILARTMQGVGMLLLIATLAWAGWLLIRQWQNVDKSLFQKP